MNEYIEDPTIRVKAPDSMLNKLGNTAVNLTMTYAKLKALESKLSGEGSSTTDEITPLNVMAYVGFNQEYSWLISDIVDKISDLIGDFEWDDKGELVRLT